MQPNHAQTESPTPLTSRLRRRFQALSWKAILGAAGALGALTVTVPWTVHGATIPRVLQNLPCKLWYSQDHHAYLVLEPEVARVLVDGCAYQLAEDTTTAALVALCEGTKAGAGSPTIRLLADGHLEIGLNGLVLHLRPCL